MNKKKHKFKDINAIYCGFDVCEYRCKKCL